MKTFLTMGFCLLIGLSVVAGCSGGSVTPSSIGPLSKAHSKPTSSPTPGGPKIYVADTFGGSVTIYAASASGNAAPIAAISGRLTGLNGPAGVAVDTAGKIYVANENKPGTVTTYAAGANGNATPTGTISGASTGLSVPVDVALDAVGNIYVTNAYTGGPSGATGSVTVYAAGANGNAAPAATISGANTGLAAPYGLAIDAAGNIYVANSNNNSVTIYAAGANGNATPTSTISGANTGLDAPFGVALDGAGNIYVANGNTVASSSITVYAAGANGDAIPTATISGASTGLYGPQGVALDAAGKIYAANVLSNSLTIYAAGANGNAAPTATISGKNAMLDGPFKLVVH